MNILLKILNLPRFTCAGYQKRMALIKKEQEEMLRHGIIDDV